MIIRWVIVVKKGEEYYLKIMSRIQINRVLPQELCIQSIDDILYSIGLCHHSVRDRPKRSLINKPLIITMVNLIQLVFRIVTITTGDKLILRLTADVGHLIGVKQFLSMAIINITMIVLFSQLVYYYNHSIGVKPTFIRVIQVFSGSITPSSVGLNNSTQVQQLLKIAKLQPLLKKNNTIVLPFMCLSGIFIMHLNSLDFISSLILFIYPAIFYSLWAYYFSNIVSLQNLFFYILCKYFLIKLKESNRLLNEEQRMNTNRIRNILRSFDVLYHEIHEFNSTYWSKYLLNIWLFFGTMITFLFFIVLFNSLAIEIRISLSYFLLFYLIMYIFILSIASSVNMEANKSYKLFNSFFIKFRKTSKLDKRRLAINQIKVNYKVTTLVFSHIYTRLGFHAVLYVGLKHTFLVQRAS